MNSLLISALSMSTFMLKMSVIKKIDFMKGLTWMRKLIRI